MSGAMAASTPPQRQQWPILAEYRIARRQRHLRNGDERLRVFVLAAAAKVVRSLRRIGADHAEILAAGKPLMSGAGRQHGDIAGGKFQHRAIMAAELHFRVSARDAERFV